MSLEVSPQLEREVREYTTRNDISLEELLSRAIHAAPLDTRAHVQNLLAQWQKEDGVSLHKPVSSQELFQQWAEEDAQLSETERQEQ
jgi:hypothetical protein